MKNELIQEGGNGRNIELTEVYDLQIDSEILVVGPQKDSQSEVPKYEVHAQYTPPLRRSDKVHHAPLRFDDNMINIIQDDDPLTNSKAHE